MSPFGQVIRTNYWTMEILKFLHSSLTSKSYWIKNSVDTDSIHDEWQEVKLFISRNLYHLSRNEIWCLILNKYSNDYPNFKHVIMILLVFPISNAKVERGFSGMLRIKTDFRSTLGEEILEHLMAIGLEGPELSNFNPGRVVDLFLAQKPRRVNVQPYGPRAETLKRKAEEELSALESETRSCSSSEIPEDAIPPEPAASEH